MKTRLWLLLVLALLLPSSVLGVDGAALYNSKCAVCHGTDGAGKTAARKKLTMPDLHDKRFVQMSDKELFDTIGRGTKHKEYAHTYLYIGMNEEQVNSLVAHIRKLQKPEKK